MDRTRRRAANPARREKRRDRPVKPVATGEEPIAVADASLPSANEHLAAASPPVRRPITAPGAAPSARRAPGRTSQPGIQTDYVAIGRDMRRVGVLSGILIATLIALTFVLR